MRSVFTVAAVVVFSLPSLAAADSLRCGQKLVSHGDSKVEVEAKCGEPASKETRVEYETRKYGSARGGDMVVQERTVQRTIEEWTYNFGPSNFIQYVTFEDGRMVKVRSGKYGY